MTAAQLTRCTVCGEVIALENGDWVGQEDEVGFDVCSDGTTPHKPSDVAERAGVGA